MFHIASVYCLVCLFPSILHRVQQLLTDALVWELRVKGTCNDGYLQESFESCCMPDNDRWWTDVATETFYGDRTNRVELTCFEVHCIAWWSRQQQQAMWFTLRIGDETPV